MKRQWILLVVFALMSATSVLPMSESLKELVDEEVEEAKAVQRSEIKKLEDRARQVRETQKTKEREVQEELERLRTTMEGVKKLMSGAEDSLSRLEIALQVGKKGPRCINCDWSTEKERELEMVQAQREQEEQLEHLEAKIRSRLEGFTEGLTSLIEANKGNEEELEARIAQFRLRTRIGTLKSRRAEVADSLLRLGVALQAGGKEIEAALQVGKKGLTCIQCDRSVLEELEGELTGVQEEQQELLEKQRARIHELALLETRIGAPLPSSQSSKEELAAQIAQEQKREVEEFEEQRTKLNDLALDVTRIKSELLRLAI